MKKHLSQVSSSDLTLNSLLLLCFKKGVQRQASVLQTSRWQKTKCHFSFRSHSGLKSHYVKSCCFKSSSCYLITLIVRFLSSYPTSVNVSSRASVADLFIQSLSVIPVQAVTAGAALMSADNWITFGNVEAWIPSACRSWCGTEESCFWIPDCGHGWHTGKKNAYKIHYLCIKNRINQYFFFNHFFLNQADMGIFFSFRKQLLIYSMLRVLQNLSLLK